MSTASYALGIAAAVLTLGVVIEMLRRRRLRERHAVWWLLAGILALIIGVFPSTLEWAAHVVGVEVPTNLIFFASVAILFLVSIQHSAELTDLEGQARTLADEAALLRVRLDSIEEQLPAPGGRTDPR